MKIQKVLMLICLSFVLISGCGSSLTGQTGQTASWAYEFVVWKGDSYKITSEKVTNVGKEIGQVTHYSDREGTYSGNFSNRYPVGTKYYEIQGVDTNQSIAIQTPDGSYLKAVDQGKYVK